MTLTGTGRPAVDGRAARAERTRSAVVDALLALIDEGDLRPTAARIAERAGVSLRSVFQHFEDLEALLAAACQRQLGRISDLVAPLPTTGTLEQRVRAAVEQRANLFEQITPVRRAALLQEPFSATLRGVRDRVHASGKQHLEDVFAVELRRARGRDRSDLLAALDAATSWETWEQLRARQSLSVASAKRVVTATLLALLSA